MPKVVKRAGWDTGDWSDVPAVRIWDYDPRWATEYGNARRAIAKALGNDNVVIEHIGSTAVPGLAARRGIDIMIGVGDPTKTAICIERLVGLGYAFHFEEADWAHLSKLGVKVHVVPLGGDRWVRHLLFRDYLRAHPDTAAEYERTKRELADKHGGNGQRYVDGKTAFVETVLEQARREIA